MTLDVIVFFEGAEDEQINEALQGQNLQLPEELQALMAENQLEVGLEEFNIDQAVREQLAALGGGQLLGTDRPVSVLYEHRGTRGTEDTPRRMRLLRAFGEDDALRAQQIDPHTGRRIGSIQEVEPYFEAKHIMEFFNGLSSEEVEDWGDLFFQNGLITEGEKGGFNVGDPNDPYYIALEIVMTYVNIQGIYDRINVTDPRQAIIVGANAMGANRTPIPEWKPATVRLLPDPAELASVVQDYARNRFGGDLTANEVNDLVMYLQDQYRLSFDQQELLAEREWVQQQVAEGRVPSAEQRRFLSDTPEEVFAVDPAARFEQEFNRRFSGRIEEGEDAESRDRVAESVFGGYMAMRRNP